MTMTCGHDSRWLAYRNPADVRSEQYCVFCEIERLTRERDAARIDRDNLRDVRDSWVAESERLQLRLVAAEARAAYWEHDSDCCGGCSKCSRLAAEMQAAEKARVE